MARASRIKVTTTLQKQLEDNIKFDEINYYIKKEGIYQTEFFKQWENEVSQEKILEERIEAQKKFNITSTPTIYINDNPFVQNSLYFGNTLGNQPNNWNDPQATGGTISSVSSFTIAEDDMNWGMILPFDIKAVEIQCSFRPGGTGCTGDDFTLVLYTANRQNNNNNAITLTRVAAAQTTFVQGIYVTNDLNHTANLDKGTMIYCGIGSEDATSAKNGRGIMNITITQR